MVIENIGGRQRKLPAAEEIVEAGFFLQLIIFAFYWE
jgi:hypothetical protein